MGRGVLIVGVNTVDDVVGSLRREEELLILGRVKNESPSLRYMSRQGPTVYRAVI